MQGWWASAASWTGEAQSRPQAGGDRSGKARTSESASLLEGARNVKTREATHIIQLSRSWCCKNSEDETQQAAADAFNGHTGCAQRKQQE